MHTFIKQTSERVISFDILSPGIRIKSSNVLPLKFCESTEEVIAIACITGENVRLELKVSIDRQLKEVDE